MSNNKKYFWLKLKDDFFTSREIKKLRKIAGGDTYTIIYLKMQLLSIQKEGLLVYEGTEEDIVEQLSLELDEETDNISVTLSFLQANNLIEQLSENEFLLNKVPECIGNETDAAERMRKMRAKRNNVTPELQPVTKSYTEKELELERDIELELKLEEEKEKKPTASLLEGYSDEFIQAFNDFKEMRKQIKAKMTPRAEEMILKKLHTLSKSEHEQIEILNQSTMNAWKGVFPLKGQKQKGESTGYEPDYEHGIVL